MAHPLRHALRTLPAALALLGLLPAPGGAAVHVWTGANGPNWSDAGNWAGGLPVAGGELLLDSTTRPASFNDLAGGLTLLGLTLGANAPAPTLSGNALRFDGAGAYLRMLSSAGHGTVGNDLVLNSSLQVTGGPSLDSQLFLTGDISGSGGFTALGGRTVLGGDNSFTGATTVDSGARLGVAGGALAGTSGIQVARGGELQIVDSNVVTTLAAPIALGGTLSSSAGVMTLFPGVTTAGGQVASNISLTDSASIAAVGGTPARLVRMSVFGTVDRASQALTLTTGGSRNELNVRSVSGDGALTLRPNGGVITVAAVSGTGQLRATGPGGSATVSSLGGEGRVLVDFDGSGALTLPALSGQHDLDVRGGTLELGGAVPLSFSGQITLRTQGTLSVGRESILGTASPVLQFENGGRLALKDGFGLTRDIVTTGGMASVAFGRGSNTVSGSISGDGGIQFGGRVLLTGNNSFAGGLGVLAGGLNPAGTGDASVLSFNHDGNLGLAGQGITLGGTLALPDGYALSRPLTVSGKTATISGSGTHVIASPLSGDGTLNLTGAARYVLTGTATHTGGVALAGPSAGQPAVLVIDSDARLGGAGGVLNIGRIAANNVFVTLPGTLVAAGNLDIAATRSTTFRSMTVDTNGFDVVFNQPISGFGMTKTGTGTWTLNTANTDSSRNINNVSILQGSLQMGVDDALGASATANLAAGAQLLLGGRTLSLNLASEAGSTVDLGVGGVLRVGSGTLDGELIGQGSVIVRGGLTLNGANSFAGTVEVQSGRRLTLGHVDALGAAGNLLRLDNGTLETSGRLTAPLVISNATNLQIGAGGAGFMASGQSLIIERALTGPLALRLQGGSRPGDGGDKYDVRLAHRANSFTGDLQLGDPQGFGSAVLGITADGSLGAASNRLILGKSFFDGESTRSAQGGLRAWDSFTLGPTRTVLLDGDSGDTAGFIDTNGHTVVVAGSIGELASGLGLLKTGAGTLVLNGQQAYTGLTTVEAGALGGHGEVERLTVQTATLAPGESAGLFSVRQDLSFSSGALLALELGGTLRGNGYDALNVGGAVDLGVDTVLQLSFINGFTATTGQQFQLINASGGVFGTFANVADGERLLTTDGTGSFLVHYGNGQGLVLSDFNTAAVPEPSTWALLLAGAGLLAWRRKAG